MIKNLRICACSHGRMGSTDEDPELWTDEHSFGWYMAKNLNLTFINRSQEGACNFHIFKNIYDDLPYITDEDLVLVQWSYVDRAHTHENYTIMPHRNTKTTKVYYKHFYDDLQEINKVLGFTSLLDSIVPNFYFNFANGSDLMEYYSPLTFKSLKNKKNYLNINSKQITYKFHSHLIDRFHLTETGHEILAEKYVDKLVPLIYN